ncbi:MAG: GAF domain-containing protein, partial [Aliifodinibius sp.]|nr:GAF domain-containing protein [Candidatus Saccharibacteria bacterium]NIT61578.1 GAF domain-containing protein [Fodinibius sp.]NIV16180.1 GAF domain-containing protein [Fodinibius sp.]NIY30158.1 GAF domain-containing protein [Fodinibius sp.]
TGKLLVKATRGYSTEIDQVPTNEGIVTRILHQPEFYSTGNVEMDKDFLDLRDGKTKSQITAPLLFEGRMLGSITLESDEANAFSRDEEAFLSQLANQSAIAVQN